MRAIPAAGIRLLPKGTRSLAPGSPDRSFTGNCAGNAGFHSPGYKPGRVEPTVGRLLLSGNHATTSSFAQHRHAAAHTNASSTGLTTGRVAPQPTADTRAAFGNGMTFNEADATAGAAQTSCRYRTWGSHRQSAGARPYRLGSSTPRPSPRGYATAAPSTGRADRWSAALVRRPRNLPTVRTHRDETAHTNASSTGLTTGRVAPQPTAETCAAFGNGMTFNEADATAGAVQTSCQYRTWGPHRQSAGARAYRSHITHTALVATWIRNRPPPQSSSGGNTICSSSMASLPAISTAWVRLVTPSLRRIAVTWALIVASDTLRS